MTSAWLCLSRPPPARRRQRKKEKKARGRKKKTQKAERADAITVGGSISQDNCFRISLHQQRLQHATNPRALACLLFNKDKDAA